MKGIVTILADREIAMSNKTPKNILINSVLNKEPKEAVVFYCNAELNLYKNISFEDKSYSGLSLKDESYIFIANKEVVKVIFYWCKKEL